MGKKLLSIFLVAIMLLSLAACDNTKEETTTVATTTKAGETTTATTEPDLPYDYGMDVTFHADEPTTYSMYFSDASWYALTDTWKTEGIFAKITELTNVTLDITAISSNDYTEAITLEIGSGQAKYIIPKVYDESDYVAGGAVVPVSDYVQYMPYYQDFVTKYNMQPDLATITKADGKYYRLPGMLEAPMQDYTLLIRNDIFKAAGVDVAALESDWTWNDLCDELIKVKAYMVENGMCKASDYIWSDLWSGSESGQGNGGNLLKLMGASYGVPSGWAVGNGMQYDADTDSWYFASVTDDYKEFITVASRFVNEGILSPETFTQDDSTATSKFFTGETVIMSVNRGKYADFEKGITEILGTGNFELYVAVSPIGSNTYIAERNRLENGVMISQNALDDLGEEGFIEMMRFVDWLWYSPEAYVLTKWGVEGETFEYVTNAAGDQVKQLLPGFKCGGLGISNPDPAINDTLTDIRVQWGYAGGVFYYGGTLEEMRDNFIPVILDFNARIDEYRTVKAIDPAVAADEDQNEALTLIKTELIQNVNTWTLLFVTGQKDITADWDEYVASCENLDYQTMVDMTNEIYKG